MVEEFTDMLETTLSSKEVGDNAISAKANMDRASKGNNVEYILDGAPKPQKKDMQPYTIYVYKDAEGEIYVDSKNSKGPENLKVALNTKKDLEAIKQDANERLARDPKTEGLKGEELKKHISKEISKHVDAAELAAKNRIDNIKKRLSDINHAEGHPLGSKETDLADIRAITAVAIDKKLVTRTYRQAREEMLEGATRGAVALANKIAKNTPDIVKSGVRETAALVSIPINTGIAIALGGEKTIALDKNTIVGGFVSGLTNKTKAGWDAAKESKTAAIRIPVKLMDTAANAVHTVTNSKQLGRTIGVVAAAAVVSIPGIGWVAGGVMAAQTIAGARSELEREGIDIKKRQLTDLVAASHQKQEILKSIDNPKGVDLHAVLQLSNSALRETPKPTSMYYRAAGTSMSAELKTIASVSTNAISMGIDAATGNAPALALKTSVAVSGAVSGFSAQVNEDEAKRQLNAEIKKLEAIAPEAKDNKGLAQRSKEALIEVKALELAANSPGFKDALDKGESKKIGEVFESIKLRAAKECEKEWQIEADAKSRSAKDPKFREAVEEARGKGPHSHEVMELKEKFEVHQKAAETAYENEKKGRIEREANRTAAKDPEYKELVKNAKGKGEKSPEVQARESKLADHRIIATSREATAVTRPKTWLSAITKPSNIYHNKSGIITNTLASISRSTNKELFAERTQYADVAVKNSLAKNAEYMAKHDIVDKQSFGGESRVAERKEAHAKEQAHAHTQAQAKAQQAPALSTPPEKTKTISEHISNFAMRMQDKFTAVMGASKGAYTSVPSTKVRDKGIGGR